MNKGYLADQITMDIWNKILDYKKDMGDVSIQSRRTWNSFCQNLIHNGKRVGCIYVFGLQANPSDFRFHGYVARFYINKEFRHSGYALQMMHDIIAHFGFCVLHITSASPNRIEGLTDENREEYRNRLYKFYEHFGFKRTSTTATGMIRQ